MATTGTPGVHPRGVGTASAPPAAGRSMGVVTIYMGITAVVLALLMVFGLLMRASQAVGGGNSAGQAIVYLARYARQVHVVLRGQDLGTRMSRYLVDRIEQTENVVIHRVPGSRSWRATAT